MLSWRAQMVLVVSGLSEDHQDINKKKALPNVWMAYNFVADLSNLIDSFLVVVELAVVNQNSDSPLLFLDFKILILWFTIDQTQFTHSNQHTKKLFVSMALLFKTILDFHDSLTPLSNTIENWHVRSSFISLHFWKKHVISNHIKNWRELC